MHVILADVVAEQQALDQFLQGIGDRDWKKKTPTNKWTVHQHIAHLAAFEEYALDALTGKGAKLAEAQNFGSFDEFVDDTTTRGPRRSQEVIEWWRLSRAPVIDALSRKDPGERIPWFGGNKMAAKTFATSRLVETWLHAVDIHETFDSEPEELPRLEHIAWFAWKSLPAAFEQAGEKYEPIRVEVIGPRYAKWVFGPEDADNLIKGKAAAWCRLAVGRLDPGKSGLTAQGDTAETALRVARTYL